MQVSQIQYFNTIRRHRSKDNSFDEEAERSRQKYIIDELACLEKTLAKRQAQLRDTERSLKECKSNLLDAKEQVITSTVFFIPCTLQRII